MSASRNSREEKETAELTDPIERVDFMDNLVDPDEELVLIRLPVRASCLFAARCFFVFLFQAAIQELSELNDGRLLFYLPFPPYILSFSCLIHLRPLRARLHGA